MFCVLVLRACALFGYVLSALFCDFAEDARGGVGVHARTPRKEDALNALGAVEGGLDALPRLPREGGKGEEDDICLPEVRLLQGIGKEGEIAALVGEALLPEKVLIFRKEQGEVLEFPAQRAARLLRALQEKFLVDAGRGELGERLVHRLRRALFKVVELALLLGEDGGDGHHRALLGEQFDSLAPAREKARKGGDFGEHGAPRRVQNGALRKQGEPVLRKDERLFALFFVLSDGNGEVRERVGERGCADDRGHTFLLRADGRPWSLHYSTFGA